MHETQLARQLLDFVVARAGRSRVLKVRGSIAETEALNPDSLAFHFRAHAAGTVAEAAELTLTLVHVKARCSRCSHEYLPEHHLTLCPRCSSTEAQLLQETGVRVSSLEVE